MIQLAISKWADLMTGAMSSGAMSGILAILRFKISPTIGTHASMAFVSRNDASQRRSGSRRG